VVTGLSDPHGLAFVPSDPNTLVAGDPPTSSLGVNNALTTTGVPNPGLDHLVTLFNQSMAAGFPEQHGGITTNALSQITTNEQQFLAQPHHA
jgi:hypothetical protein